MSVVDTRTNLCTNPSAEYGITDPWAGQGVVTVNDSRGWSGRSSFQLDQTGGNIHRFKSVNPSAGTTYTYAAYIWADPGDTFRIRFGGTAMAGENGPLITGIGDWQRVKFSATATGTGSVTVYPALGAVNPVWVDGIMFVEATILGSYFDGDTRDDVDRYGRGWRYKWSATPGASTSTAEYVWFELPSEQPPEEYPLRVTVYDKNHARLGWVNAQREAHATIRHNLPATCTFGLDDDHWLAGALATPGARAEVHYMGLDTPRHLVSGRVKPEGQSTGATGTITYTVTDDKSLYWTLLGWPNPDGTIDQQGNEDAYYTASGPAETVVKNLITANAPHIATNLTTAADQGRGGDVKVSVRMHPLADRLLPAVDLAGIGLDAYQDGAGITADIYVPSDLTGGPVLTEASGVVQAGTWSLTPPTVTRVIVGGPGEGVAREWEIVTDTQAEAKWGLSLEQVRDARDIDETSPTKIADMRARGQETLDEGAESATITAQLAETAHFRVGVAYWLGDLVPVQLTGAPVLTDRVRSIDFDLTPDEGLVITPHIGVDDTFASVTTKHIARLAAGLRDLRVSR